MESKTQNEIIEQIKQYLTFNGFSNTLECFETHLNEKPLPIQEKKPEICSLFKVDKNYKKSKHEIELDKEILQIDKSHGQILYAARQIFGVSINCLQLLYKMKDV